MADCKILGTQTKIVLSISTGCRMQIHMEDQQKASQLFACLAGELLAGAIRGKSRPEDSIGQVAGMDGHPQEEPAPQEGLKTPSQGGKVFSYRGFLHFKCPECGKTVDKNLRQPQNSFGCMGCGKIYTFSEPLQKVLITCPHCEKVYTYWTNQRERLITINCIDCGEAMTAYFNEKTQRYEG